MARQGSRLSTGSLILLGLKGLAVAAMIGTPLAGVWLASSLAAFANRSTLWPVAAGLLLFPALPLAWEGVSRARARKKGAKRFLTFGDRMILRTLAVNVVFLGVLLAAFPQRAFVALSARGDWMLDGHHGATAEQVRRGLLGAAGGVEWLYTAARKNPYRDATPDDRQARVDPVPPPKPTASSTPAPTPSASSAPTPAERPNVTPPFTYPMPATLHPVVASMPAEVETSIEAVGRYIAERERDPRMRVKALHDYVADRVAYDAPNYAAGNIPHADGDPKAVFRSRVGVCAGYARLLAELGKVTGDEIVYVLGDARSESSPMEGEGHAWNAAKIDGQWYLIDATWDAGSVDGATFKKRYSTDNLFAPPDQFAIAHFPEQPKWQLLEKPLTRAEFFRRPVLAPAFFAHGLVLKSPDRSQVAAGGALDVVLENPRGVWLLADFTPKSGGARTRCNGDNHTQVRCAFPTAGTFDVRLYVNEKQYGQYGYVGAVQVNARP